MIIPFLIVFEMEETYFNQCRLYTTEIIRNGIRNGPLSFPGYDFRPHLRIHADPIQRIKTINQSLKDTGKSALCARNSGVIRR